MGFLKRIFSLETLGDLTEAMGNGADPGTEAAMRYLNQKITQQQRRKSHESMVPISSSQRRR